MTSVDMRPPPARAAPEDLEAERLFGEYSGRILAYSLRRLGSRSEAEDAVQMTFLYALRALRRGVVPECETAWLYAIAKNVCRSQLRTSSRRCPAASGAAVDTLASPDRDDDTELLVGLRDALDSIPERQRDALLLREWRGLPPREIATHLGLSAPATHALLTRARCSLARALTAPRRTVLGLASLVYELRAHLKAALGGASAKTAAATVAVVGVGVGGLAVEQSLGKEQSVRMPATPVPVSLSGGKEPGPTTIVSRARHSTRAGRGAMAPGIGASRSGARLSARIPGLTVPEQALPPAGSAPGADTSPLPDGRPEPTAPGSELPAGVPLDTPALPQVDLPTELLPPVELPPVDLPTEDLPVDLPPLPSVPELPLEVPPGVPPVPDLPDLLP